MLVYGGTTDRSEQNPASTMLDHADLICLVVYINEFYEFHFMNIHGNNMVYSTLVYDYIDIYIWLVVTGTMEFYEFHFIYWECHQLTFTPSFVRGVGIPPSSNIDTLNSSRFEG